MTATDRPTYAPDWTARQRADYQREWLADLPIEQGYWEHYPGECDHCDLLWQLQREADAGGELVALTYPVHDGPRMPTTLQRIVEGMRAIEYNQRAGAAR